MSADISDEEVARIQAETSTKIRAIIDPARALDINGNVDGSLGTPVQFGYEALFKRVWSAVLEAESEALLRVALADTEAPARIAALEAERDAALSALKSVEWLCIQAAPEHWPPNCPLCRMIKGAKHKADCALGLALYSPGSRDRKAPPR